MAIRIEIVETDYWLQVKLDNEVIWDDHPTLSLRLVETLLDKLGIDHFSVYIDEPEIFEVVKDKDIVTIHNIAEEFRDSRFESQEDLDNFIERIK